MKGAFATALLMCRNLIAISQNEIARRTGLDHSYISRLERGERSPSKGTVMKIAKALELDEGETDQLLASAGYRRRPVPWRTDRP